MEHEAKGDELFGKASDNKSLDDYTKAANQYKIGGCWLKAGHSFEAIAILNSNSSIYATASNYTKAGDMFIKCNNFDKTKECLSKAIKLFLEDGKFASAASSCVKLAEVNDNNNDKLGAIEYYELAYKYYDCENSTATGYSFLLKAAYCLIDLEEYDKALQHLIKCCEFYETKNLTLFKAKKLRFEITIVEMYLCKPINIDKENYNPEILNCYQL